MGVFLITLEKLVVEWWEIAVIQVVVCVVVRIEVSFYLVSGRVGAVLQESFILLNFEPSCFRGVHVHCEAVVCWLLLFHLLLAVQLDWLEAYVRHGIRLKVHRYPPPKPFLLYDSGLLALLLVKRSAVIAQLFERSITKMTSGHIGIWRLILVLVAHERCPWQIRFSNMLHSSRVRGLRVQRWSIY